MSLAVLACFVAAFWGLSYARSIHQRRKAERLLQELKALQLGAEGFQTVQQIAKEFGGKENCSHDACNYDFAVSFAFPISGLYFPLHRTEWDYLGLRPWRSVARIGTRDDEITDVQFFIIVGRGRGWLYDEGLLAGNMWAWLDASIVSNSARFDQYLNLEKEYDEQRGIDAGKQSALGTNGVIVMKPVLDIPGGGEALDVYLSPTATPEGSAAFNLNLRCATAISACTELCQLAPAAWQSYSRFQKSNGWAVEQPAACADH
jgi:hypothetical protein